MQTRISSNIQLLISFLQEPDILEGLKANALTRNQGNRSDSINDSRIKCIQLESRFAGFVLQALGAAKINFCS
jgi:hypothetical protein